MQSLETKIQENVKQIETMKTNHTNEIIILTKKNKAELDSKVQKIEELVQTHKSDQESLKTKLSKLF